MKLKRASLLAGIVLLLSSLLFLAGWLLQRPFLFPGGPTAVALAPNSAISFALAGLTLIFLSEKYPHWLILARISTILLTLLSFSRLLEFYFGGEWGVDEFFISYAAHLPSFVRTGVTSVSAINFLLSAIGFIFLLWRRQVWAGDVLACSLALVVGIIGLVYVGGYLLGEPVLFAFDKSSMAFPTSSLFVLLAAGLLSLGLREEFSETREPFTHTSQIPIEKKLSVGAGAALGVVVLMGLLSYNNTVKFIEASRTVEQTQRLLTVLEATLANIVKAEADERGYVLTSQAIFLDSYQHALLESEHRLQQLVLLASSNPDQKQRVARVIPHIRMRLLALSRVVELCQAQRREEAEGLIATGEGQRLMDQIHAEAETIISTAQAQLLDQAATRDASRVRTLLTFAIAAFVVAGILLGVHMLLKHDLSGRRQAEAALRRHNETLDSFAHTVAHDLRAPLRGIEGYASELTREHGAGLGERARFCLTQINSSARNLEQLIQDTLDFARLESESLIIESVDLSSLVESLLQERAPQIGLRKAEVTTVFHCQNLRTWKRGLTQVLANLLDNALKYSRHAQPPTIHLETAETAKEWLLTVRDNGIGFDMKHHDRIFGLFQRLVTTTEFEGNGAGLAIAKKITQRLGGTMRAESSPGAGAAFFVRLPKTAALPRA